MKQDFETDKSLSSPLPGNNKYEESLLWIYVGLEPSTPCWEADTLTMRPPLKMF